MLGEQIHDGHRHFTVRRENGRLHLLPAWMTELESASAKIVADPFLPVDRLLELRTFLDVLVASRWEESPPVDGGAHVQDDAKKAAAGSVRGGASRASASGGAKRGRKVAVASAIAKAPAAPAQAGQEAGHDEDLR